MIEFVRKFGLTQVQQRNLYTLLREVQHSDDNIPPPNTWKLSLDTLGVPEHNVLSSPPGGLEFSEAGTFAQLRTILINQLLEPGLIDKLQDRQIIEAVTLPPGRVNDAGDATTPPFVRPHQVLILFLHLLSAEKS